MKKVLIIILIPILLIIIGYFIQKTFNVSLTPVISNIKFKRKTVFEKYSVESEKIGDKYYVVLKDIVATSADHDNRHIKVDLYIEVNDKEDAKKIARHKEQTVFTITDTMTNFKTSDLTSPAGKKFFKQQIKRELELKYGKNSIKDIYITNMVFN